MVAHKTPRGAVAAEPAYVKPDGTRVTSFGPCLKKFAGGAEFGTVGEGACARGEVFCGVGLVY